MVRHERCASSSATKRHARACVDADLHTVPGGSIETWLNVVVRLLHLPDAERESIHDELRAHLNERVRDLMIFGKDEASAVRLAIEELGEASELAKRFDSAGRWSQRRLLMKITILGIMAIIGAVGVSQFSSSSTQPIASIFEETRQMTKPDAFAAPIVDISFEGPLNQLLDQLNEMIAGYDLSPPMQARARWGELQEVEITPQSIVVIDLHDVSMEECLDVIALNLSRTDKVTWRYDDRVIELAPQRWIDEQETVLVSYPVADVLHAIMHASYGAAPASAPAAPPSGGFRTNDAELAPPAPPGRRGLGSGGVAGGSRAGGVTPLSEKLHPTPSDYDRAVSELSRLLTSMVSPYDWEENGGDLAQLQIIGGKMFVAAPQRMQAKVEWILNELRNSHGVGRADSPAPDASSQRDVAHSIASSD